MAPLLAGVVTSAVVGFLALAAVMRLVKQGRLHYFAPYCWAVGLLAILLS